MHRAAGLRPVLLVVLPLLVPACAPTRTYAGPPRPAHQTATLRLNGESGVLGSAGYAGEHRYDVRVCSIDGRAPGTTRKVFEVLPGRHVVVVDWTRSQIPVAPRGPCASEASTFWLPTDRGRATLVVDAVTGTRYEFDGDEVPTSDPPMRFVVVSGRDDGSVTAAAARAPPAAPVRR